VYLVVLLSVSNVEVKTEADSNDVTECSHDDKPTIGMLSYSLQSDISCSVRCFSLIHCSQCFHNLIRSLSHAFLSFSCFVHSFPANKFTVSNKLLTKLQS